MHQAFAPGSAVVLAELSPEVRRNILAVLATAPEVTILEAPPQPKARAKEEMMHRVANVRMLAPGLCMEERKEEKKKTNRKKNWPQTPSLEIAEAYCKEKIISGIPCIKYARYCYMVLHFGAERSARVRPTEWLLKLAEEIFDSSFIQSETEMFCFATRVLKLFSKKLDHHPKLLEQCAWDFLAALDAQRRSEPLIEVLASFVQEAFDKEDLDFFLYIRSLIPQHSQTMLTRTQAKHYTDTLSPHLFDAVLKPVFGTNKTSTITVAAFLLLLLQAFHNTKSPPPSAAAAAAAAAASNTNTSHSTTQHHTKQVTECEDDPPPPPPLGEETYEISPTNGYNIRAAKAAYITQHFEDVLTQVPQELAAEIVDQVVDQMPHDLDPSTISPEALAADIKPLIELLATYSL